MKKSARIILWLSVSFALAGIAWAVTVTYQPYGIATPRIYQSSYGYRSGASSYYLATPTLTANDTIVGLAATQTLTNKTLTAPTLTAVSITGTSTIGTGMTITSPSISGATITGSSYAGSAALTTGTVSTSLGGGATATLAGFNMLAAAKTASYSIVAADCGKLITASTSGAKEFDLPPVAGITAGWMVTIANSGAATLTVNPNGTDSLILGLTDAAGDAISNATVGNTVTLVYTAQGWCAIGIYGTWADAN